MKVLLMDLPNQTIGQNVSLAYLAAALRRAGHEVRGVALSNHRELRPELVERRLIEAFRPDLIGVSLFYCGYYQLAESLKRIRTYHQCATVVGGPQMNVERDAILRDIPELDFGVVGEADASLPELCEAISGGLPLSSVRGLIYRRDGEIVSNPLRPGPTALDALPFPDYGVFGVRRIRNYMLMSSRGCPFSCTFCYRSTRKWRARSPENMVAEIEHAKARYDIEEFTLVDDAFNLQPGRVIRFLDLLEQRGHRMRWSATGGRLDQFPDELLRRMQGSGYREIGVGVETLQPEVFATLHKGETLDQVIGGIRRLKGMGFFVRGYFMIGIPGDTPQGTLDTYRRAEALGLDEQSYTILLPVPGTAIYDQIIGDPRARILEDYRKVSLVWYFTPEHSVIRSSFELPEYPAQAKVDMYLRLWARQGYPRPPWHASMLVFGAHAAWHLLKYDPWHLPRGLVRMGRRYVERVRASRTGKPFWTDIQHDPAFLAELATAGEDGRRVAGGALAGERRPV